MIVIWKQHYTAVKEGSRESLDSRVSKWSIYETWQ